MQTKGGPREDKGPRPRAVWGQKKPAPGSQTSGLQSCKETISVAEAPSVCGTCYSDSGKLTHQLPYRSSARPVTDPPQGLCTCCSLCPECSSPRHPHGFLPHFLQLAFSPEAFSGFPTSSHNILPPPPTHPIPPPAGPSNLVSLGCHSDETL